MRIRNAVADDLAPVTTLYNHYVTTSSATFDLEPVTCEQRRPWFEQFTANGPWQLLVGETEHAGDGALIGFACSTPLRPRAAYRRSVETTIYLAPDAAGRGLGATLYRALLDALAAAGVHRAYGVVTVPNPASTALHEKLGYERVGRLSECGWKFERWWDVAWYEYRFGTEAR